MNARCKSLLAGLVLVLPVLPVVSQASPALAQKHACGACHAVDRKLVGPSFRDVARKYAGEQEAVARLSASIRAGGAGRWGAVPMPAQPRLSEADARALAAWVLGGAN